MLKKYRLEIYPPGNEGYDVVCHIESDEPFLPIQRGDLINPRTWNAQNSGNLQVSHGETEFGIVLRVTGIEHFIVQRDDNEFSQHKLGVFTEAVDDIAENRP
jgi:hypothetical protein